MMYWCFCFDLLFHLLIFVLIWEKLSRLLHMIMVLLRLLTFCLWWWDRLCQYYEHLLFWKGSLCLILYSATLWPPAGSKVSPCPRVKHHRPFLKDFRTTDTLVAWQQYNTLTSHSLGKIGEVWGSKDEEGLVVPYWSYIGFSGYLVIFVLAASSDRRAYSDTDRWPLNVIIRIEVELLWLVY